MAFKKNGGMVPSKPIVALKSSSYGEAVVRPFQVTAKALTGVVPTSAITVSNTNAEFTGKTIKYAFTINKSALPSQENIYAIYAMGRSPTRTNRLTMHSHFGSKQLLRSKLI